MAVQAAGSEAREAVLRKVAGNRSPAPLGHAKFRVGEWTVHTRFCGEDSSRPDKYKFNVNPNTLSADFELWMCGHSDCYYLMPIPLMRHMYDHPDAYPDRHHPAFRVVTVDSASRGVMYARGGESINLRPYFRVNLPA